MKKNNSGFSLVELIIVIAIMAVLIGVLAPQFIKYVEKSKESKDISNLDSCISVVQAYYADKDFPAKVTITAGAKGAYFTASPDNKPLTDAGADKSAVTGDWKYGMISAEVTSDGKITYSGEAVYYKASATGFDAKS